MLLIRREIVIGVLLAATGLLAWWYRASLAPEPRVMPSAQRRPDFVVERLTAVTMDQQGKPERRLSTPELRHYPDDGSSELDSPVLTLFDPPAPPWQARARSGWVSADGKEWLMQEQVRINRDAAPGFTPMVLKSSELLVLPDDEYAETDRFVELESGDDWVSAQDGMQAWFGQRMRVRFFGRTRARVALDENLAAPSAN